MARTRDYSVRFVMKEDGVERDVNEARATGVAMTQLYHNVIQLSSSTSNYQLAFGSNFTTPTILFLQEQNGRTFTYSVNANSRHHPVAASGTIFEHSTGITSLYFSNNSTNTTKPIVEVILAK